MKVGDRVTTPFFGEGTIVGPGRDAFDPFMLCNKGHTCWEIESTRPGMIRATAREDSCTVIEEKKEETVAETKTTTPPTLKVGDLVRFNDNIPNYRHSITGADKYSGTVGVIQSYEAGNNYQIKPHSSEGEPELPYHGNGWYWKPDSFKPFTFQEGDRVRIKSEKFNQTTTRNGLYLEDLGGTFEGTVIVTPSYAYRPEVEIYLSRPGKPTYYFDPEDLEFLERAGTAPVVAPTVDESSVEAYKLHVLATAKRYGVENDLCDTVDDFLRDINIDPGKRNLKDFTISVNATQAAIDRIENLMDNDEDVESYDIEEDD